MKDSTLKHINTILLTVLTLLFGYLFTNITSTNKQQIEINKEINKKLEKIALTTSENELRVKLFEIDIHTMTQQVNNIEDKIPMEIAQLRLWTDNYYKRK